jgi:MFS superfamily sulfate permease-like transporter
MGRVFGYQVVPCFYARFGGLTIAIVVFLPKVTKAVPASLVAIVFLIGFRVRN